MLLCNDKNMNPTITSFVQEIYHLKKEYATNNKSNDSYVSPPISEREQLEMAGITKISIYIPDISISLTDIVYFAIQKKILLGLTSIKDHLTNNGKKLQFNRVAKHKPYYL